jgi:hypothetical protein
MPTFEYTQTFQMKAILLTLTTTLLFSVSSFGQKSMVKFQIGYGFPIASYLASQNAQVSSTGTTYTGVYGTYGGGFKLEAGYIGSLTGKLFLEMDFAYLIGKSINATVSGNGAPQHQSISSRFYEISPLLRMNFSEDKIKPYAAIGPVFGLGTVTSSTTSSNPATTSTNEAQRQYTGSVAIGAKSVAGAELTQGPFIFYAQITLIAMSYSPDKSELTKYTLNGINQLPSLTTYQKETVYKNSITTINNSNPDPTQPNQSLKFYIPFSNISLNAGVMFKF